MSNSVIRKFGVSAKAVRRSQQATVAVVYVAVPVQVYETSRPELECPPAIKQTYLGLSEIRVFSPGASESNEGLNSLIGLIGARTSDRPQIGIHVTCHLFAISPIEKVISAKFLTDEVPAPDDYASGCVVWAKIL